ncbi:hypothetical protein Clacol_001823 [Clathrus columnatus]|uniref:1-phosphatidylinositol 4-kinase n=1 Tax=Clathrus columnatus TaxID=1419009 RepID=A0AAV4ZZ51_9AGAM|nr:hypothetical protein Clacol_001823 [Clathrus columnatus]
MSPEGLVSTDYGRNLLSSNIDLITEVQTHLRKIQELAISIMDPKGYNAVFTSDSSSTGTRPVHRGPFSITFSSAITDKRTSYVSKISIAENKIGWHERTEILNGTPGSRPQLSAVSRRLKLYPTHQNRSVTSQVPTDTTTIEEMDNYLKDIDWLYLLVSAGDVARARRRQKMPGTVSISSDGVDSPSRGSAITPLQGRHNTKRNIERNALSSGPATRFLGGLGALRKREMEASGNHTFNYTCHIIVAEAPWKSKLEITWNIIAYNVLTVPCDYGLELNLRQMVLRDLARNVGQTEGQQDEPSVKDAIDFVYSKVETRDVSEEQSEMPTRVFMSTSRVQCNMGFAELAPKLSKTHTVSAVSGLIDILRDIPYIDFDKTLSWTAANIISQFAPSFHGFYRAVISTPFPWSLAEWHDLSLNISDLFLPQVVERLNNLLVELAKHTDEVGDEERFVHRLLARYVSNGRPLTGYFSVCCVIEIQGTVLAQCLCPPENLDPLQAPEEAAAANAVWSTLISVSAKVLDIEDQNIKDTLHTIMESALRCYTDLLLQLEELEGEPSLDTYAWETMSESIKLASICSIALQDLHQSLFSRLKILLSDSSPVSDALVQEAALEAVSVLVQNFQSIAQEMTYHLRRFIMSPLSIFELEFTSSVSGSVPLMAAAKCLALCIKYAPGDDRVLSNMYSLLNYLATANTDLVDGTRTNDISFTQTENGTIHSLDLGKRGYTEEEKRLVSISCISVVTHLALEFHIEEVTKLTISMLLQRLRSRESYLEPVIAQQLVDLALMAPENAFMDITQTFSSLNRSRASGDPSFSGNAIIAAQTRLAKDLYKRPELRDVYLRELLILFSEKGVNIQTTAVSHQDHHRTQSSIDELSALLLPIAAILDHRDFKPNFQASPELITLFRNMWFLSVLFRFTSEESATVQSAQHDALVRIALKTPALVKEEEMEYVTSAIEYNSVIRQDYIQTAVSHHKDLLMKYIPIRANEIRHLHHSHIIFLMSMHDIEILRLSGSVFSNLSGYFVNSSLNKHPTLGPCMDAIGEKIMRDCQMNMTRQISEHNLPRKVILELKVLLVHSCHRVSKSREIASRYLNRLITSLPSLMCSAPLVFAILETLTMLRHACEGELIDEFNPVYEFTSERTGLTIELTESYLARNEMLSQLYRNANNWFSIALVRAPIEFQATLQKYLTDWQSIYPRDVTELGASMALQFGAAVQTNQRETNTISGKLTWKPDRAKALTSQIACKEHFAGEPDGIRVMKGLGMLCVCCEFNTPNQSIDEHSSEALASVREILKATMVENIRTIQNKTATLTIQGLKRLLFRCASILISDTHRDDILLHYLVALPFEIFTPSSISSGIEAWTWVISERCDLEMAIMLEFNSAWMETIRLGKGMFSQSLDPCYTPIEYSPTEKADIDRAVMSARRVLMPHTLLLQMLSSRYQAVRYNRPGLVLLFIRLALRSARAHSLMSKHPLARECRFTFLSFAFEALKGTKLDSSCEYYLRKELYLTAFSWFASAPQWSFGANRVQLDTEIRLLNEFLILVQGDLVKDGLNVSVLSVSKKDSRPRIFKEWNQLLRLLVESEIARLCVWRNPSNDPQRGTDHINFTERGITDVVWKSIIQTAWKIDPAVAIYLPDRFKHVVIENEIGRWVRSNTRSVVGHPHALKYLLGERLDPNISRDLKHLLIWEAVTPITAIAYFEPRYNNDPLILQYAHRVLVQHPVDLTFFFVPQVVQALRNDPLGYVERFIFETTRVSQLFCHQIIWNMEANSYKDDASEIEDPIKPVLDNVINSIISSLSGEAKEFFDREFLFFNKVTSISGKLKPFIKKSKPEKKAKIDEEMAKIDVDVGVYLPSNPDGVVVDIDKKSGRPLQSHAKAPFMATFKVRKKRLVVDSDPDSVLESEVIGHETEVDIWQQAIFKVGDDCRQDMLALQVIAMFKNVFNDIGLSLYLYPYRVTATGPGRGIIDVVPNATSRDEMGRAKINDLSAFFTAKYGSADSLLFQRARLNFIQSMAAYSVTCYILQIKDRHNGNILIDGEGHITHIDFGFLFDIDKFPVLACILTVIGSLKYPRPGGVKFEPNSFKLNHEMVNLMGGRYSQGYILFVNLTVKAFLAIRPHAEQIINAVHLMLGTGLPSFKGEGTIKRLRDRFVLELNEREAADYMMKIIKNAYENLRSTAYDEFQRLQNG